MTDDEMIKAINEIPEPLLETHTGRDVFLKPVPAVTQELAHTFAEHLQAMEPSAMLTFIQRCTDGCEKVRMRCVNLMVAKEPAFIEAAKALHTWRVAQHAANHE